MQHLQIQVELMWDHYAHMKMNLLTNYLSRNVEYTGTYHIDNITNTQLHFKGLGMTIVVLGDHAEMEKNVTMVLCRGGSVLLGVLEMSGKWIVISRRQDGGLHNL